MKTITKLLVFTCLVLLMVGIVSATEITSNTTSTTEHPCEIADNTQTASHQASLNEQDINKIEKDEKTDVREDIETKKIISKNTNKNVKEEPETGSWENLTQAVSNAESATEDTQ